MRAFFLAVYLPVLGLTACSAPQEKENDRSRIDSDSIAEIATSPAQSTSIADTCTSFDCFLQYLTDRDPLAKWPWESQQPFIDGDEIFSDDTQSLDSKLGHTPYNVIPRSLLAFVPVQKIKMADEYSSEVRDPYNAFKFYGFEKVKYPNFWLAGIFARKLHRIDSEYHAHYFILSTYTFEGKPIDDCVWWSVVDDTHQGMDGVAVDGDSLLVGHADEYHLELDEVFQKTVITQAGKFKTVYSNFPKSTF